MVLSSLTNFIRGWDWSSSVTECSAVINVLVYFFFNLARALFAVAPEFMKEKLLWKNAGVV